ncbi:MAG: hypothetical protein ABH821_05080 [archaeon]
MTRIKQKEIGLFLLGIIVGISGNVIVTWIWNPNEIALIGETIPIAIIPWLRLIALMTSIIIIIIVGILFYKALK